MKKEEQLNLQIETLEDLKFSVKKYVEICIKKNKLKPMLYSIQNDFEENLFSIAYEYGEKSNIKDIDIVEELYQYLIVEFPEYGDDINEL